MKNWLTQLLQKKFNQETYRDLAIRRITEADDWNRFDRNRFVTSDRNESRIEAARRTR